MTHLQTINTICIAVECPAVRVHAPTIWTYDPNPYLGHFHQLIVWIGIPIEVTTEDADYKWTVPVDRNEIRGRRRRIRRK
jgi:hypothetical protein